MSQEVAVGPAQEESPKPARRGTLRFLRELPVLVVLALGIALLIKAFLVQAFYIPSASMEPTLERGDRVLVSKLSYRLGQPKRGDVIVFHDPVPNACDDPETRTSACDQNIFSRALNWVAGAFGLPTGDERDFIKRIVALPGETVEMRDGRVYVCDQPGCEPLDRRGRPKDGRLIEFPSTEDEGPQVDDATVSAYEVPEDQYWVLGDHRSNSSDSRSFDAVDRSDIIGKAFVLVWPPTRFNGL